MVQLRCRHASLLMQLRDSSSSRAWRDAATYHVRQQVAAGLQLFKCPSSLQPRFGFRDSGSSMKSMVRTTQAVNVYLSVRCLCYRLSWLHFAPKPIVVALHKQRNYCGEATHINMVGGIRYCLLCGRAACRLSYACTRQQALSSERCSL